MSAARTSLPSEYEIAAESLVRVFAREPDLLLAIERAIARHRDMKNEIPQIVEIATAQQTARRQARAIRQILEALLLPQYQTSIDRKNWEEELERYERESPRLVEKIRSRIESQIKNSEHNYDKNEPDRRCETR